MPARLRLPRTPVVGQFHLVGAQQPLFGVELEDDLAGALAFGEARVCVISLKKRSSRAGECLFLLRF